MYSLLPRCSEARIQCLHGNISCLFWMCTSVCCFLQTHFVNILNFIHCTENWRQFCLRGSRCFKGVVLSECSSGLVSWAWSLAYGIFFACPMCYKIQAQGGGSSSVHLAGATVIFFPEELICKFSQSFHTWKTSWNSGCNSKLLYLCHFLCKAIWNVDQLDCVC